MSDTQGITLWQGDCLERMREIEPGSVDLILCDLPYGSTALAWDVVIPFEPLWENYRRILKSRGAVVLTASQPFTSMLVMSNQKWFRYGLVWDKVNRRTGYGNCNRHPLKRHEDICVFYNKMPIYNPQMRYGKPYRRKSHGIWKGFGKTGLLSLSHVNHGTRFPDSIISIPADIKSQLGIIPTQKPVALMEYLVRTYSNEGDIVLDNCMGSGTTGLACVNTKRRFIGIEKDPVMFEIAARRIERPHAPVLRQEMEPIGPLFAGMEDQP